MRLQQDGAAGRLVDAARLHADEAVLDQVEAADAVVAAEIVQRLEQGRRRQFLAVERYRIALAEGNDDLGGGVGRIHRRDGAHVDVFRRLLPRVFQNLALGGGVQE